MDPVSEIRASRHYKREQFDQRNSIDVLFGENIFKELARVRYVTKNDKETAIGLFLLEERPRSMTHTVVL